MKYKILIVLIVGLFAGGLRAQQGLAGGQFKGSAQGMVRGMVVDSVGQIPMEYVNIVLYGMQDSSQVTGTITDSNGRFRLTELRPGRYFAEVSFMGYQRKQIGDIRAAPPSLPLIWEPSNSPKKH